MAALFRLGIGASLAFLRASVIYSRLKVASTHFLVTFGFEVRDSSLTFKAFGTYIDVICNFIFVFASFSLNLYVFLKTLIHYGILLNRLHIPSDFRKI